MPDPTPRLVLLHLANRQPRGAWFDATHRDGLLKAAAEPNHAYVELDVARLKEIAPTLGTVKISAAGRPDPLPVMLAGAFEKLLALATVGPLAKAQPPAAMPGTGKINVPVPWSDIVVGSVVLASDAQEDGWFECTVLEIAAPGLLRIRWRDYPDYEPFHRPVERVGLMPISGKR